MDSGGLPLVNHVLQYTLRSLCADSQWVYAVFWRILPRNYPPPKWDTENGFLDRSKGNKRNWILVWEDGFCDFLACRRDGKGPFWGKNTAGSEEEHAVLQPELFFKMSHEIYNYGEGVMGKVAADNSHKWIYRDPPEHEISFLSPWQGSLDPYPRTWEAQFKAGIQTIAIVAVAEGLLQLGSTKKIMEDLNFVILIQRKFNYLQSIPGVFAPHPMPELASTISHSRDGSSLSEKTFVGNGVSSMSDLTLAHCVSSAPDCQNQVYPESHLKRVKPPLNQFSFSRPLGCKNPSAPVMNSQSQCGAGNRPLLLRQDILPPSKSITRGLTSQNGTSSLTPSMSSLQTLLSKLPSVTPTALDLTCNLGSSLPQQFSASLPALPRGVFPPSSSTPLTQPESNPVDNTKKCSLDRRQQVSAMRFSDHQFEKRGSDVTTENQGPINSAEKEKQSGSILEALQNISDFSQISDELRNGDTYTSLLR